MIRDTLIGIILLACLAIAHELLGPTGTLLASAASMIGFLAREVWERRRRELEDRRSLAIMQRNRERLGMDPDLVKPADSAPELVGIDHEWAKAERRARHLSGRGDDPPGNSSSEHLRPGHRSRGGANTIDRRRPAVRQGARPGNRSPDCGRGAQRPGRGRRPRRHLGALDRGRRRETGLIVA